MASLVMSMERSTAKCAIQAKGVHFYSASTQEANNVITQSRGDGYDLSNALNVTDFIPNSWGYVSKGFAWFA